MSAKRVPEPGTASGHTPVTPRTITRVEIPASTLAKISLATLLTIMALWLFTSLARVFILVVLSLLIAVVLSPLASWLERKGIKRGFSALISIVVVMLVLSGVLAIAVPPLIKELHEFFDNLPRTADSLRTRLSGNPALYNAIEGRIAAWRRDPAGILTGALHFGFGLATNVFAGVLILTLSLYFLIDGQQARANVLRLTAATYRSRVDDTMSGIAQVIKAYFIGRSIISGIFAAFTFLLLTVLHVPYATVFAALSFFFGAIPNIGSALATILPSLVALAYRGITTAVIVAAALLAYNQLENNYVQPRILSKTMNLSPIATMVGVLAGGKLLGVIGVILAVPVVGTLPVLARVWMRRDVDNTEQLPPQQTGNQDNTAAAA